jgi:hypothetical protein
VTSTMYLFRSLAFFNGDHIRNRISARTFCIASRSVILRANLHFVLVPIGEKMNPFCRAGSGLNTECSGRVGALF